MNQLSEDERIAGIHGLSPTGEKKWITYKNQRKLYDVYDIPLKYLVYNPYNGRIRSLTLSYEAEYGRKLNAQDPSDKEIIEQFLYDSASSKNEKTRESIENVGQQEAGIITFDGVVIDGNRRSMTLNHIAKSSGQTQTFKAVILEDRLMDNQKEIITLETSYQMGVDSKVDYNPIEKYIRCKELETFYTPEEIAVQMSESVSKINEWLDILHLMEEYLIFLKTPELYIRLERREGHFVDLFKYVRGYIGRHHQSVDWNYNNDDVQFMKEIYFSYIRLAIPVAAARIIAKPASKNSFFCHYKIWKEFAASHSEIILNVHDISIEELKQNNPDASNISLVDYIDKNWKRQVQDGLEENLFFFDNILSGELHKQTPLKLLRRAKGTLYQIDINVLKSEIDDDAIKNIEDIASVVNLLKALY